MNFAQLARLTSRVLHVSFIRLKPGRSLPRAVRPSYRPAAWQAVLIAGLIGGVTGFGHAETFYSYVNRNGITVFSNYQPSAKEADKFEAHNLEREENRPDLLQFDENRYNRFDDLILKFSQQYEVEFNLVKSLILVESNFNPKARSPKGAMGLMQLMPGTAERFNVKYPYDPEENIRGGVSYLHFLMQLFAGDLKLVLSAYNAGENLVKRIKRIPDYRETQNYVKNIMEIYESIPPRTDEKDNDKFVVYTPGSRFFRYLDESGTLTLTNVDPPAGAQPTR